MLRNEADRAMPPSPSAPFSPSFFPETHCTISTLASFRNRKLKAKKGSLLKKGIMKIQAKQTLTSLSGQICVRLKTSPRILLLSLFFLRQYCKQGILSDKTIVSRVPIMFQSMCMCILHVLHIFSFDSFKMATI